METLALPTISELEQLRKGEFPLGERTNAHIKVWLEVSDIEIVESEEMKGRKERKSKSFRIELKRAAIVSERVL